MLFNNFNVHPLFELLALIPSSSLALTVTPEPMVNSKNAACQNYLHWMELILYVGGFFYSFYSFSIRNFDRKVPQFYPFHFF